MTLPKLAAFDVDGTLITHHGQCSDRTRATLAQLRTEGVLVAIATGRPRVAIGETVAHIGEIDFAICGNGSSVSDLRTGEVMYEAAVPAASAARIITTMRREVPGIGVALEVGDTGVEEPGFEGRIPPRSATIEPVTDAVAAIGDPFPDIQRVTFFHDDFDHDTSALGAIVQPHLDATCALFFGPELPLVEVLPAGVNKGVALASLATQLNLRPQDVMAFGDGTNDLEMFAWSGRSVAMGRQCHESLLAVATAVTDHVDDDGVANHLEPLFG